MENVKRKVGVKKNSEALRPQQEALFAHAPRTIMHGKIIAGLSYLQLNFNRFALKFR